MKKLFFLPLSLALISLASSAFAIDCAKFAAEWDKSEQGTEMNRLDSIDLANLTAKKLEKLAAHKRSQIKISAETYMERIFKEKKSYASSFEALVDFRGEHSVGNEAYAQVLDSVQGPIDYIQHFPGDNEYGYVFETGTDTLIAMVHDGDVVCEE